LVNPRLDFEPDPAVWLVGPTEDRSGDDWMDPAVDVTARRLGIDDEKGRAYVASALATCIRDVPGALPYRLIRWRSRDDIPLPVFLGMVYRDEFAAAGSAFLEYADQPVVEKPIVETLTAPEGRNVRRCLGYTSGEDSGLAVGLRYVVDSGSPELVALMQAASDVPAALLEALSDIDDLATTVTIQMTA
jgi:hypothetical protein